MKTGRSPLTRVALAAAWVALAGSNACSRTEDPLEHYATTGRAGNGSPSGGAQGSGAGPTQQAGKNNGSSGSPATTGGTEGAGAEDAGGAPAGGSDPGPSQPTDFGCGEPPVSSEPFSKRALRSAAADCALYHYCRFEGGAAVLQSEIAAYVDEPSDETLAAAQAAFAQAMSLWSVAELFQFGPAGSSAESAGKDIYQGQGIRELIHPWPLTTRCRVEEQVVLPRYDEGLDSILISGRGLFGLDYLLHYAGSDTSCAPSSAAAKAWAKASPDELAAGKLEYANVLGSDVLAQARALRAEWAEDGGNFRPLFVDATGYPSDELKVMTVMAWSLIYIEREVKDWKLGIPAGYTLSSPVSLAESPYSGLGTENVRANLRGFRALFQGCGPEGEGLGFDDWLTAQDHGELASDVIAAWQKAQEAADGYPQFSQASAGELEALYRAVKGLTDLIKNDLFGSGSPLKLDLPQGVASDTD